MRQKVVIACGLVRHASVLLFDEPLTGLDPRGIRRCVKPSSRAAATAPRSCCRRTCCTWSRKICTRVVIMDRGKKVADGTVAELGGTRRCCGRRIQSRADLPQRD